MKGKLSSLGVQTLYISKKGLVLTAFGVTTSKLLE